MDVETALDSLAAALTRADIPLWDPPDSHAALDELEAEIAPMRLPRDVREFWRRVDVSTVRADPYPRFAPPDFALRSWRRARDEFAAYQPLALGPRLLVPRPGDYDDPAIAPPAPAPHPVHGAEIEIGPDILDWPEHWRRANGMEPGHLTLRGTTHTVAEVLAIPLAERAQATIAGRVEYLMGSGPDVRVRVDDGTAAIDVSCPPETTLLGPRIGDWFEFDVVVPAGERRIPPDPDAAEQRIEDPADRLAAVLVARHDGPVGAKATAVRRMPPPG